MTYFSLFHRLVATVAFTLWTSWCTAQTLALTFDDGFNPDTQPQASEWNTQLLNTLRTHRIKAGLFPALVRIGGADGLNLVSAWAQEGHLVGNHTASHPNLAHPDITLEQFVADVLAADAALRHLPTFAPMLRFPYLKEGNTQAKRDGVHQWMAKHEYKSAPVSIDASDWYYNRVYADQLKAGNTDKAARVQALYIDHLLDRAAYYDQLARQVLDRSPSHVILLHTNQINAATLPAIITAFQAQGWTIISARDAFQDQLYAQVPDTLPAGESIIWAHAQVANIQNLRYPAEDAVYEEPTLRAAGLLQ